NAPEGQKAIKEKKHQMSIASIIEGYLKQKKNQFNTVASPLTLQHVAVNAFILQYNTSQLERKKLVEANVPENNPLVRQQDEIIEKLRTNILAALANVKSSENTTINSLRGT